MDIKFCIATMQNCDALTALVNSAYRGESSKKGWTTEADLLGGQRTDPATLSAEIKQPNKKILCAYVADRLVGCVSLEMRRDQTCYFGMLTVDPEMQANGLGRRILDQAENVARGSGATKMTMCVINQRNELISWYERRGYKRTGLTGAFPYNNAKFGLPKRNDLYFSYFEKNL